MNKAHQNAFTMIELIFVIVIIGVLAAVAIPKLAATRDDAAVAALISHVRKALGDFQSYYTSQGTSKWITESIGKATNVPLKTADCSALTSTTDISPTTFVLCHDNVVCISLETEDEGNLTITSGSVTTDAICEAVKSDPAILMITGKEYRLGGEMVIR